MSAVSLSLLGGFQLTRADGVSVEPPGQKEQALLTLLVMSADKRLARDELAALLWSDRGAPQARDSVKHAVAGLRRLLGDKQRTLLADRQAVWLDPEEVESDVADFEALAGRTEPEAAERAIARFRGDLLAGSTVRDPAFQDWLETERRRLRALAEEAAARVMRHALARNDPTRATTAAERLLELNPFREDACRALMQCRVALGQRPEAIRVFNDFRQTLRRDLGIEPAPETTALGDRIRADREAPAFDTAPPLPDRPSIAVLAFEVMGGDPEQEYFAEGVVEDIIGGLSRIRGLFVIARSSSFAWKGRGVDMAEIGRALGVRYILEGSVRRSGGLVRIAGRLADATTRGLLWAETFEGDVGDIFAVQDRVTARVVGAVAPKLEQAEIERARRKPTGSLDAYDSYLRGLAALHLWQRDANLDALRWFSRAREQDPSYAAAHGMAARCYSQRKACGWVTDRAGDLAGVQLAAHRAVETGPDDAVALATAGIGLAFVANEVEEGAELIDRALALNPNLAAAWLFSGWVNGWLGNAETALDHLTRAMRLSPQDPQMAMMQAATGYAHFVAGSYDEAARWAERSTRNRPSYQIATCILAASLALSDQTEEAARAVRRLRAIDPTLRLSNLLESYPIRRAEDSLRWTEGMRRAGLPE